MVVRKIVASLSASALIVILGAPTHAAVALPPCVNYKHHDQWGSVYVDLRQAGNSYTTLTIWWIVEPPTGRSGPYTWQHIVNGKPVRNPESAVKDDALHTVLRQEEGGRRNWKFGDTYHLKAEHYSPARKVKYIAVNNLCRIEPR